jgi:coenzyme F420-reducing hydrogenase beta subunit
MIVINDKTKCCGCYACYNICPQYCIKMVADKEGFWYPVVDIDQCNECGLCEKVCPILCRNQGTNQPVAYACINKDESIRSQSSSGGVFTLIGEKVIANNGVVFGVGFDTDFNVVHSWVDDLDGLSKFRGSKYVQSNIGSTYKEVKEFLKQGRQVLFTGTPCQIAGLKSYLGKEYDQLICIDIVCHGVPSPLVWGKYVGYREKISGSRTERIAFRRKNCGWKLFSVSFSFDNETEYIKPLTEDIFMQGFLKDLFLRPSCYECSFKTLNRQSDITLADFWGVENILPEMFDDQGTSLALVHSDKGREMLLSIEEQMISEEVDIDQAILFNPSAVKSVDYNPKRDKFFKELNKTKDINKLISKYIQVSFPRKAYGKIRSLLGRSIKQIIY